jgi:hypothetical protein
MKKMPTSIAENVYRVLTRYADAKSDYYSSEEFIFHFGVVHDTSDSFKLTCMDDSPRTFVCKENGDMWLIGKGSDRANPILRKISREMRGEVEIAEFIVRRNAI